MEYGEQEALLDMQIQDGDYLITTDDKCNVVVKISGTKSREIGEFPDYPEAYAAINKDMRGHRYFPNVWYVNTDNGNYHIDTDFSIE